MKNKSKKRIREDKIDIQIAEKRWKEFKRGEYTESTLEEFLKDMKTW
jgi:hypothetical protein